MKVLLILVLTLFVGCETKRSSSVALITGTYVGKFQNEYTINYDTVIIAPYNPEAGTFLIESRTGFRRKRDGKVLSKEFKLTKEMGIYYAKAAQLVSQKRGVVYTFPPSGEELLAGTAPYKKIN